MCCFVCLLGGIMLNRKLFFLLKKKYDDTIINNDDDCLFRPIINELVCFYKCVDHHNFQQKRAHQINKFLSFFFPFLFIKFIFFFAFRSSLCSLWNWNCFMFVFIVKNEFNEKEANWIIESFCLMGLEAKLLLLLVFYMGFFCCCWWMIYTVYKLQLA